ncbi:hypothetical protein CMUST_10005 [Corynebacterium mustelae]|uniref:Uncharacterized protein n=1 Tax=Corynebacterium mustelae TaxID=571915 RepID=A0A0G3H5C7_9CORY|nr:hypothetical protein [Corynebacterium mustelae]AKK06317.1 hypothetical protein CMUST_10005 [Corynebacterium mustelae]
MIALVLVIIIVGVTLKIVLPTRAFHAVTAGTVLVAVPLAVWNIRDLTELFVLVKHQRAYEQPLATDYDLLTAPPLEFAPDYNIRYCTVFRFTSRTGETLHRSVFEKAFTDATITITDTRTQTVITTEKYLDRKYFDSVWADPYDTNVTVPSRPTQLPWTLRTRTYTIAITIPHSPELEAIIAHYSLDVVAQQGLHADL